jgi:D-aminoacyl-tRNA deacylase
MKIALIISTFDYAGLNIKEKLLSLMKFKDTGEKYEGEPVLEHTTLMNKIRIYTSPTRCVHDEHIDKKIGWGEMIIYPITHRSEAGTPSLTAHAPGNWGKAELGGEYRKLCRTDANMIKAMVQSLHKHGQHTGHEITMECTHHGPYVDLPIIFIEIGSAEEQWKDDELGMIIAKTLKDVLEHKIEHHPIAFGIGGTHYCTNFRRIIVEKDIALGHVCPKYALENLDADMIKQAMEKSDATFVILDWKGMGTERERIVEILDKMDIRYFKAEKLKKMESDNKDILKYCCDE